MNFKTQKPMNKRMNGMKLKWERLKCKFLSDEQEILVEYMQPTDDDLAEGMKNFSVGLSRFKFGLEFGSGIGSLFIQRNSYHRKEKIFVIYKTYIT